MDPQKYNTGAKLQTKLPAKLEAKLQAKLQAKLEAQSTTVTTPLRQPEMWDGNNDGWTHVKSKYSSRK